MKPQKTLEKSFSLNGIGVHSGKKVKLTVRPAPENHGIVFQREDLINSQPIPAHIKYLQVSELSTSLVMDKAKVQTIEHLLASLYALEIDNALISLNSAEAPILDGSAKIYVEEINKAGIKQQTQPQRILRPSKEVCIKDGDKTISISPHIEPKLVIDYTLDYPKQKLIGKQQLSFELNAENFQEIASARTFCLKQDIEFMQKRGLALGGSLDNAIVVDGDHVLNEGGLRLKQEFVKHKILDCIGDLSLLGCRVHGKVKVHKGGHALHHKLSLKLGELLV